MLRASDLRGHIYPAVPVPFDSKGQIVAEAQERYADWMSQQPIGGVAVWAHTGRGLLLSSIQRELVLRTWRKALGTKGSIIAGVGAMPSKRKTDEDYLAEAEDMGRQAVLLGADALLCFAPVLFRGRCDQDDLVLEYHRRLAALGRPLILFYLYEAAGGINYSIDLLDKLFQIPEVIGIKMATLDSVMTFQDVSRFLADRFPETTLISGEDRFLGYSFLRGATSALIGMGAGCTSLQYELLRTALAGEQARFLTLLRQVDALAECTFVAPMEGYIQRMLWVLVHQNVLELREACDPWGPKIPDAEFETIGAVLQTLES